MKESSSTRHGDPGRPSPTPRPGTRPFDMLTGVGMSFRSTQRRNQDGGWCATTRSPGTSAIPRTAMSRPRWCTASAAPIVSAAQRRSGWCAAFVGLGIRPMLLWTPRRIVAHAKLCVLALMIRGAAEIAAGAQTRELVFNGRFRALPALGTRACPGSAQERPARRRSAPHQAGRRRSGGGARCHGCRQGAGARRLPRRDHQLPRPRQRGVDDR
jgi:hypothetical protein